jgi:hypothetical protein
MLFNRSLLEFEIDSVIYNNVNTGLTRQNLFDYVAQTGFSSEDLILLHYKNSLSKIRDEQIEKILNDRNEENKMD